VSTAFVSKIFKWVFAYWAWKGEDEELMMEEAQALASLSRTAANHVIDMDDHIIQVNVGNMLRKIMQDCTSWKAIRFLESLQQQIQGFVFSVWFDSQGLPDALYMTPQMHADLVQFGYVVGCGAHESQKMKLTKFGNHWEQGEHNLVSWSTWR
jgi:hypothetical protein